MNIESLTLQHFRCFESYHVDLKAPIIIIEGLNGTGKTSLLEALHYACYFRSFRTHASRDLASFDQSTFFVAVKGSTHDEPWDVHVGKSHNQRIVKFNGITLKKYHDLVASYKIISIIEQDLAFITGSPEDRRDLLDQALLLYDHAYAQLIKQYRHILEQRNALLVGMHYDDLLHDVITEKLWHLAFLITQKRVDFLHLLEDRTRGLLQEYSFQGLAITLAYQHKKHLADSYEEFKHQSHDLFTHERFVKRTIFGPHLDDILISFGDKSSRQFASRGQQKLILCLFKLAQCTLYNHKVILLLDDIMTDFDTPTAQRLFTVARDLSSQMIITTPVAHQSLAALEPLAKVGKVISLGKW